jgi:hypothetical protein
MRARLTALLAVLGSAGCAGHTTGDASDGGGNAACATIAAPLDAHLAHVSATGANATAIAQALDVLFAAQSPPVNPGQTYAIPTLDCGDVEPPFGGGGYACTFQLQPSSGAAIAVTANPPSTLAQGLYDALTAAGATTCDQGHGPHVVLQNMTVSPGEAQYDDVSHDASFPTPNLVVHGADAESLVAAFAAAGIDDCDPTRYVFLICSTLSGAPSCSYQWMPLDKVGSSYALPACGSGVGSSGPTLAAAPSLAIWRAVQRAATDAGFHPLSGTIAQANVVNARYFTWNGSTLTATMTMDDATPP